MLLCYGWKESDRLLECIDSVCDGNENSDVSSEGEGEGKLLGEGEEGGSRNSHCCVVFSVAMTLDSGHGGWRLHLHFKCSQNMRPPAADQLVFELTCGQTAHANYLGVILR